MYHCSSMFRRRKSLRRLGVALLVVLLCGSYGAYALSQPLAALIPKATFSYSQTAQDVPLAWPSYGEGAVGAVGYGVLATHGSDAPLPTASTIKILTALAVLQQQPLGAGQDGPLLTLTATDVASYDKYVAEDGSVVRVVSGEQLSERQALEALLLPSANNMAETLARWAFGSIGSYLTYANTYARTLGMTATTVTDPSGFLPTTLSTAHDLTLLGEAALANPVLAQIVSEPSAVIPVQGAISNVNVLLGQEGIVGIKTGNNDQDTGCFLFAARQSVGTQQVTIVGTLMDGPDLGTTLWDALPLISSAASGFREHTVIAAGSTAAAYATGWQGTVAAVAGKALTLVTWNDSATTAQVRLQHVRPSARAGATAGTLTVRNTAAPAVYTVPLVLKQSVNKPNIFWRLTHPF